MIVQTKCPHCGNIIEISATVKIAPDASKRYSKIRGGSSTGAQYGSVVKRHGDGTVSFEHPED